MKNLGQLIAGAAAAEISAAKPVHLPETKRAYRVRLARHAFYEVEIQATNAREAERLAEQIPLLKSDLDFHTAAHAISSKIWIPRDGGQWVDAPRE